MTALPDLTSDELAQLRRMCGVASDDATYTTLVLNNYAKRYALIDKLGVSPKYILQFNNDAAPTYTLNDYWTPTWDFHAIASEVWEERATSLADGFDFSADNASYRKSQKFDMYMKMARYHNARRSPNAIDLISWHGEPTSKEMPIINAAE
jgi:hypothetical protein